jgi:hypothetical protein
MEDEGEVHPFQRATRGHYPSARISGWAERLGQTGLKQGSRRSAVDLGQQGAQLRLWAAELADGLAVGAEQFAAYLENSAARGDHKQRLAIATKEHEIARIASQNASMLRDLKRTFKRSESLPKLPCTSSEPRDRPRR